MDFAGSNERKDEEDESNQDGTPLKVNVPYRRTKMDGRRYEATKTVMVE